MIIKVKVTPPPVFYEIEVEDGETEYPIEVAKERFKDALADGDLSGLLVKNSVFSIEEINGQNVVARSTEEIEADFQRARKEFHEHWL